MKRLTFILTATAAAFLLSAAVTPSEAKKPRTDFALFDGTNPANANAGALCFVTDGPPGKPRAWTFHVSVSSFGGTGFKLIYRDGDFVPFQVATGTSFSMSQAGGSNFSSTAVRIDNSQDAGAAGLAGAVSGQAEDGRVICLSCDDDSDGDAACDAIIPN
jgi:hypothetical protein